MRPCDSCGGSGQVEMPKPKRTPKTEAIMTTEWFDCDACVDLPWLPCPCDGDAGFRTCSSCGGRGRFKPDPTKVRPWCLGHDSPWYEDEGMCERAVCEQYYEGYTRPVPFKKCEVGWVARPQRLEVYEA
jgi:hypothetical protein